MDAPDDRETLLDLHRTGKLVDRYPAVPGLLAGMSGAELVTAGRLLARLDPDEVAAAHPGVPAVTVAVTGHGTLAQLVPPLTAELARHGLLARPLVSDFDRWVFDLGDPDGDLYAAEPDLTLCVLDHMVVFDELPAPWRPDDVERATREKADLVERLAERFQESGRGTLVLNTVPLPHRFAAQLVDHGSRARLGVLWREFNVRLLRLAERFPAVTVLDLDPLVAEGEPATDPRLSQYAKAHLSPGLLARYARQVGHLARHVTGRTKKALVLDLDGTVWGGIVGEAGPEGIEVADGYRGEAFAAFQRVVKQLGAQGVLLAAVSKNDPEPVAAAFRDLPGMTLREDDLVRVVANWRPKHENLTELAAALGIGVDSFVFVDDSPYERGLVRHALPGVAVVAVDEEPALHVEALLRDGWFDARTLTEEDHARVGRYRAELDRKDFLDTFDSLADYLRGLDLTVRIAEADEAQVPRLSQITLRTNQFNLTTVRLQPSEVRALLDGPDTTVLAVEAGDRFGEHGVVGALFLRRDGATLHIDNFLLSCRVFSRGIEQACLAAVLAHARASGAARASGHYRASPKNGKVADFYQRNGFVPAAPGGQGDGTAARFDHDLAGIPDPPEHIHLINGLGGEGS
ncbi:HAD-IIIC family phosphatase [Actinomadura chibensis]|uniref:HAD-IIIC family phosphatase n=1 Tax=Actinomadura chibensis TaxID=392828 RepID=A0A5D0NN15_9ACTN|nr:HAD-IIIC family phosphatase [Actinomadura chibensis]TYB45391.1 HAD-IIIC family phosphatase [Actinomadura chibensis]